MTGIILAGGKNTRMGTNKALLSINGERLIDRTVAIFKALFQEVILVTNAPLDYLAQEVQIVTDICKDKGPLGGIHSGLFYASFGYAFVSSCDMPFLNKHFIEYLLKQAAGFDVVVPRSADGLQPLHAVYSKRCLAPIARLIEADRLKVTNFYKGLKLRVVAEETITSFDLSGKMFFNVNSPDDLRQAEKNGAG